MKIKKFKNLFNFEKKSKLKASHGSDKGEYLFYTSSTIISKRTDKAQFFDESLIFGTGGSASIHFINEPFSTSTDCIVATKRIEKVEKLNTKYVYYYLFGNLYILERGFKGAGLKHISKKYIQEIDIPILPLETQNKIVDVLDRASSLVKKREQTIELLDELLRSTFLDLFGDPVTNIKKHDLVPISSIISKIDAGWSPICEKEARSSNCEWAVLKQGAVSKRLFNPSENKLLPERTSIKKEVLAQKGDLLFSRKNSKEYVGSAAYVFEEYQKLLLPDTIFNLRYIRKKLSALYLYYLMNDENYKKIIQNLSNGAAASMPNISQKKLMEHCIPLPKIDDQNKFEIIALNIYSKKKKLIDSKEELKVLFNSLSQKVFNGKLNFNIDFELDALIRNIDLEKGKNNLSKIAGDIAYLQRLIDKLNEQEFKEKGMYDKAKHAVFQLLNEGKKITQEYNKQSNNVKLVIK